MRWDGVGWCCPLSNDNETMRIKCRWDALLHYHSIENSTKLCIIRKSQLHSPECSTSQAWYHNPLIPLCGVFLANILRYVRYMLSQIRLSVCRLSVCLWRWCALLSRLKFSAIFFPHTIAQGVQSAALVKLDKIRSFRCVPYFSISVRHKQRSLLLLLLLLF